MILALCVLGSILGEVKKDMATKEDLDLLTQRVTELESEFDNVAADTEALKNEVKALNENSNVDLGPIIQRLEGMTARAKAIVGPNIGSDPEPTPAPEPSPEG